MQEAAFKTELRPNVRIRGIALPVEHGSWGFLLEPLVAGMAVAWSPASPWIAMMVIGAFLMRRPLQIYFADVAAGRHLPQTFVALRFVFLFAGVMVVGASGTYLKVPLASLAPFTAVLPFAVYQVYCDVSRQSRQLLPEITGAAAMSSSAAALMIAGGRGWPAALAVWMVFIARSIASIIYVRNRLRLEKGKKHSAAAPGLAHFAAMFAVSGLAFGGYLPILLIPAFAALFVRSAIGLSRFRKRSKAMQIGVWEVIFGALVVLALVIGYHFGL